MLPIFVFVFITYFSVHKYVVIGFSEQIMLHNEKSITANKDFTHSYLLFHIFMESMKIKSNRKFRCVIQMIRNKNMNDIIVLT